MKRFAPIIRLATTLALLTGSVSLWADPADPFPEVNFRSYYGNMTMAVKVMRGSDVLQDVVVAVYSGSDIRGKGFPEDTSNPGVSYITVYGNSTGEKLLFKVYVKSDNDTYEVDDDLEFTFNGSIGSPLSPYMVFLADALHPISLSESEGITESFASSISGKESQFIRSFSASKASTICLPFAMTNISGGKVYEFVGVEYDAIDGWVATMSDATPGGNNVTTTVANKPYLFMPNATAELVFNGTASATILAGTTVSGDWTFHGTYSYLYYGSAPFNGTVFGFAATNGKANDNSDVTAGQFVKAADGAFIQPFRAYLTYSGGNSALQAPARSGTSTSDIPDRINVRLIGSDGNITAVGTIDPVTGDVVIEHWYDINGRDVEGTPSSPGIYLNNGGKKVMIK